MKQVIQNLLSFTPTRIMRALALFVPFLLTVIWMTGYHNYTMSFTKEMSRFEK